MIRALRLAAKPPPPVLTDPGVVGAYLEDASVAAAGHAAGLVRPADEAEAAAFIRATCPAGVKLLPQAARSSLTGGAVPQGELIVSVEHLTEIGAVERHAGGARVRVGAGVRLCDLERHLGERGLYYPPAPTYGQAMIGGTVSTNAGGAASFKYGVTRDWVRGLRVVLANGDLLDLERGAAVGRPGGTFEIRQVDGAELRVPVPDWSLPPLKKISAGYYAADPLDLVDLFVGSEGTLGLVTEATLELVRRPAAVVVGVAFLEDAAKALRLAGALRQAAERARRERDASGPDVRSIEWVDARGLELLRRHGDASRLRVRLPQAASAAILFELELPEPLTDREAEEMIARLLEGGSVAGGPLASLFDLLAQHGALDELDMALPEDERRRSALREFREAVPLRVGEILAARRRDDPAVHKVGGDLVVPFEHVGEMIGLYERGFEARGLEYAIWGHLSDGNLHPNALPRNAAEARLGAEALHEFAAAAVQRGGCPLSEHGVGRSPIKQELLVQFLGRDAVERMRQIKRALDPGFRFAPGVLFPADS